MLFSYRKIVNLWSRIISSLIQCLNKKLTIIIKWRKVINYRLIIKLLSINRLNYQKYTIIKHYILKNKKINKKEWWSLNNEYESNFLS